MDYKGRILNIYDKKIYLVKGRFDYFDEKNFKRLLEEYKHAESIGAEFYVGLYSDELLEKTGHTRKLKNQVTNDDRVFMLESLDFVKGSFIIDSVNKNIIETELKSKLYDQENQNKKQNENEKQYEVGYASGAFSNLHKGHIEHLKAMSELCKTTIVAANSNRLIRVYKSKEATVDEETRRLILSHIKYVTMATITDEYDKLKAVEDVKKVCGKQFNAIFVGSDWKGNSKWEEFEKKLSKLNIDVIFTQRPENGISTTKIENSKIEK